MKLICNRTIKKSNYSSKSAAYWNSTLNLPQTALPIRSSLNDAEFRDSISSKFYQECSSRPQAPKYNLVDGPPFANGNLHVGHALNKLLKDTILRQKALQGHQIKFRPAWDCHGLPIELKALNHSKSFSKIHTSMDPIQIRKLCRKFALEAIEKQNESMKRWGITADYSNPLLTMDPQFEANQLQVLAVMAEKGLIYSAKKPVFFSPSSQTALAEAELEYTNSHVSLSSYITFRAHLSDQIKSKLPDRSKSVKFVAWTTTPWTLPSNKALAVGKDIVYSLVYQSGRNEYLIMAKSRVSDICTNLQHSLDISIAEFCRGSDLIACHYEGLSFKESPSMIKPVLLAEFVTDVSGSGLVHLAPDYGTEDFDLCRSFGIGPNELDYLDDYGNYTKAAPAFLVGMNIFSGASEGILEFLKCTGNFLSSEYYTHRFPYDWRTGKPVIQRATRQWFASISSILPDLYGSLEQVQFIPETGKDKLRSMLASRTDWCISRQRHWGVPIPAFNNEDSQLILDPKVIKQVSQLIRNDPTGSDIWWTNPIEELTPQGYNHGGGLKKSFDTLDVWFDSGTVWSNFLDDPVADLYLEGSDQYRGWFQSSLITSVATTGKAPFKEVLSHGFVLDQKGLKMSKSIGNVVDPDEIVSQHGSDVLRLWAASTNYTQDVNIGPEIIKQVVENKRKVRNTLRFILGNLYGYEGDAASKEFSHLDKLMLCRLKLYSESCAKLFDDFNFPEIVQETIKLCSQDLSAFYFDILKDRLYTEPLTSPLRQAAQSVLLTALNQILKVIKPILPFLTEEIARQPFPKQQQEYHFIELQKDFSIAQLERIQETRSKFMEWFNSHGKLDLNAKSTFQLKLQVKSGFFPELTAEELRQIFMVAGVELVNSSLASDSFVISTMLSDLFKCPRCWTFASQGVDEACGTCSKQLANQQGNNSISL